VRQVRKPRGTRIAGETKFWICAFAVYAIPNVYAFYSVLDSTTIMVDEKPVFSSLDFGLAFACLGAVLLSFVLVIACARIGRRFFPAQQAQPQPVSRTLGVLVLLVQLCGLAALLTLDFGRVGGVWTSSSPIARLTSYLHPDAVFLAYYGHARARKFPAINLLVYLAGNVLRGWGGVWMFLFFIEFYYAAQRFSGKKLLAIGGLMLGLSLTVLPAVIELRDAVRGTEAVEEITGYSGYVGKVMDRLQQYTAVALLAQEAPDIGEKLENGLILPFYEDNEVAERILRRDERPVSLQKYLSMRYLIFDKDVPDGSYLEDVAWYTNTGIAGWLFVLDWGQIPIYLLFVAMLIILPYWIAGRFIGARSMLPVLHVVAIIYVFHGWFAVQTGLCIAMVIYVGLLRFARLPGLPSRLRIAGLFQRRKRRGQAHAWSRPA
jgi:hypothetical protein